MAMRRFIQFIYGMEKKQVRLFLKATIGASGAVTIDRTLNNSQGVASITKQGTAGQYAIKLQDSYYKLLGVDGLVANATGIPASGVLGIISGSTNVQTSGGALITVQFSNGGTATNPASGDVLYMEIVLGDSNV